MADTKSVPIVLITDELGTPQRIRVNNVELAVAGGTPLMHGSQLALQTTLLGVALTAEPLPAPPAQAGGDPKEPVV